jgi:hypothetical protein
MLMMGIRQAQKDLFSYNVDLDKRVRQENPLRAIAERIDFTFVRQEVAPSTVITGMFLRIRR